MWLPANQTEIIHDFLSFWPHFACFFSPRRPPRKACPSLGLWFRLLFKIMPIVNQGSRTPPWGVKHASHCWWPMCITRESSFTSTSQSLRRVCKTLRRSPQCLQAWTIFQGRHMFVGPNLRGVESFSDTPEGRMEVGPVNGEHQNPRPCKPQNLSPLGK
jgi:hypothetical protein